MEDHLLGNLKKVISLVTPSSISALICIVVSLLFGLSVILVNRYQASSLRLEYLFYQKHRAPSSNHLVGNLLSNHFLNDLPLLIFWALIGVVIYLIAADIVRTVISANELREEMAYVHVNRSTLLRTVLEQLIIRVIVLAIWIPYIQFFFHTILPYGVSAAIVASGGTLVTIPSYLVLSVLVIAAGLHVNLVLLRLLFLRPRLFSSQLI